MKADQKIAFDALIESVENNDSQLFFWTRGVTGKTFLANLMLAKVRKSGSKALAVASSGIAATLLNDVKTAHSIFKLPIAVSLEQRSLCSIRESCPLGKLLQEPSLIIWDECTMSHRVHVEAVHCTLKDIRNSSRILGDVTFVLVGDFRQTIPVIVKGTLGDIIKAFLKSSSLWNLIQIFNLLTNMTAHLRNSQNNNFPEKLLRLGEGKLQSPNANSSQVLLDNGLGLIVHSLETLIDTIYTGTENFV